MRRLVLAAAASLLALAAPAGARAADCHLDPISMSFGNYGGSDPSSTAASLKVTCYSLLGETVNFDVKPADTTATILSRLLGGTLTYKLYSDAGYSQVWTSTSTIFSGQMVLASGQTKSQTFTVYGRAPSRQSAVNGDYSQTLMVNLTLR